MIGLILREVYSAGKLVSSIISELAKDHAQIGSLLDVLDWEMKGVQCHRAPRYEIVFAILTYLRDYPELFHHPKEDAIYRYLQYRLPLVTAAIQDILTEHATLQSQGEELQVLIQERGSEDRYWRHQITRMMRQYLDCYREHIRLEDAYFLPAASRFLTPENLDEAARSHRGPEDLMAPGETAQTYEELRAGILRASPAIAEF